MDGKRIILAAHRGDRKLCPENSMPAFEAALKLGCDMIFNEGTAQDLSEKNSFLLNVWPMLNSAYSFKVFIELILINFLQFFLLKVKGKTGISYCFH